MMIIGQVGLGAGGVGIVITVFLGSFALAIVGCILILLSSKQNQELKKSLSKIGLYLTAPFLAIQAFGLVLALIKYWYIAIPLVALIAWKWKSFKTKKS